MTELEIKRLEDNLVLDTLNELEYFSVLEKISKYAISDLGKDIIISSLPSSELNWLIEEHNLLQESVNNVASENDIPLMGLSDIKAQLHKSLIDGSVLNTSEMLNVKEVIRVSRLVKQYFKLRSEKYQLLASRANLLHENRMLEKHIEDAIDDTGNVRDNASKELQRIRIEISETSGRLRNRLQKLVRKNYEESVANEEYFTIRDGRFVIPLKAENKRIMPGIIHGMSQTGSTVFVEPSDIIEMNNDLSILNDEEKREIYKILLNLTAEIKTDASYFLSSIDILAHFDSLIAKARYALEYGGLKPSISEHNEIVLSKVYHPLLLHKQAKKNVIPLSVRFNENKRGILISGPNAGGKTVALKSIGLNIAMALSGIFPLGECQTNIRRIFTSIGDDQSIENDLSTFSSQITKLKDIVVCSDKDSLVLVDEICSGTGPQEGSALACGILDTFLNTNLFFLVTTHQSSLKTYALNKEEIENASLEFDEEKLKPTYNFLMGIPGNSYAFHLAKNVGLPKHVLARSEKYLNEKEKELEESINILSRYRTEAAKSLAIAKKEQYQGELAKKDYDEKIKLLNENKKKIIEEAKKEALEITLNANKLIENTIREIREGQKAPGEIKKEFEAQKSKLTNSIQKTETKIKPKSESDAISVGDYVTMDEGGNLGVVIEIDSDNKNALVEFGGIKLKTKVKLLTKSKSKPKEEKRSTSDYIRFDASSRIDIRGMRAEEAIRAIDEFVSQAILGNISMLTILHGKGTGALRQSIHEFLKHHISIHSFRNGELVEGGAGVTIVEL